MRLEYRRIALLFSITLVLLLFSFYPTKKEDKIITISETSLKHHLEQIDLYGKLSKKDVSKEIKEYRDEQQRIKEEQEEQERLRQIRQREEQERIRREQERAIEEERQRISEVGTVGYNLGFNLSDVDLLNRLVESEAGSEPYDGKIAVVNVVINRIKSDEYPNTINDVIYQPNQFEVVSLGTIYSEIPSEETKRAVTDALNGVKAVSDDIKLFWANYLSETHPIWEHCQIKTMIGNHVFSDEWR